MSNKTNAKGYNSSSTLCESESPLFILGCPRSGTTMLSELLSDTVWGAPFETHFVSKYYDFIVRNKLELSDRQTFDSVVSRIARERPVLQSRVQLISHDLFGQMNKKDMASLFDLIAKKMRRAAPGDSWGDKTPHYALRPDVLIELYPESKVIHIIRDGRDVALSLMKKNWGPANTYCCASLWDSYQKSVSELKYYEMRGNLLTVKYEDLLSRPREVSSNILTYLGCEPGGASHEMWLQGLKCTNYNKWQDSMSNRDIQVFESIAGSTLSSLGYETSVAPEGNKINAIERFYYKCHDKAKHLMNLAYMNTIESIQIRCCDKEPFAD